MLEMENKIYLFRCSKKHQNIINYIDNFVNLLILFISLGISRVCLQ